MLMKCLVSRLDDLPFDVLDTLVVESEQEGWKFLRRLVDEWCSGVNRFNQPGEILFAAWNEGKMVGVCGLNIDPYGDDPSIGRIRRLYVAQEARGMGVGRSLVGAILESARSRFKILRVRTENQIAGRLYEDMGFSRSIEGSNFTHSKEIE